MPRRRSPFSLPKTVGFLIVFSSTLGALRAWSQCAAGFDCERRCPSWVELESTLPPPHGPTVSNSTRYLLMRDTYGMVFTSEPTVNDIATYTHGMIQAIYKAYALGPSCAPYEIAVGDQTKKMASCLPCTLFMVATGYPPTSIHQRDPGAGLSRDVASIARPRSRRHPSIRCRPCRRRRDDGSIGSRGSGSDARTVPRRRRRSGCRSRTTWPGTRTCCRPAGTGCSPTGCGIGPRVWVFHPIRTRK